jgi:hypothetical protein
MRDLKPKCNKEVWSISYEIFKRLDLLVKYGVISYELSSRTRDQIWACIEKALSFSSEPFRLDEFSQAGPVLAQHIQSLAKRVSEKREEANDQSVN